MISFYPGPSRLYSRIPEFMQEACDKGVLSINHRSAEFVEISKRTISLFKQKLNVPEDYTIFFTSSATECWEIIAQSLIREKSYHLYNGAFGEKWLEYTQKLKKESTGRFFGLEEALNVESFPIPEEAELIAITQNETSNATEVSNAILSTYRLKYPDKIIAIDATSSMAGVYLDFSLGDVWYASVQKCFGLPAGMAVMVCSPKAIKKAIELNENKHYNSLISMIERMKDYQTTYTPNVLSVFLLMKVLEMVVPIQEMDKKIRENAANWYDFFKGIQGLELLGGNTSVRSGTVIAITGKEERIDKVKKEAKEAGLLLGNGYGKWKTNTVRLANFPAIETHEFNKLKDFFTSFSLKF
jgi:phosphoserine aminotransferase